MARSSEQIVCEQTSVGSCRCRAHSRDVLCLANDRSFPRGLYSRVATGMGPGRQRRRPRAAVCFILVRKLWHLVAIGSHICRPRWLALVAKRVAVGRQNVRGNCLSNRGNGDFSSRRFCKIGAVGLGQHESNDLGLFHHPAIFVARSHPGMGYADPDRLLHRSLRFRIR